MKKPNNPFGGLRAFDTKLFEDFSPVEALALRNRTPQSLDWVSRSGKVLHLVPATRCRGPNRLIVADFPAPDDPLPTIGWVLKREGFFLKNRCLLPFTPEFGTPSNILPAVRDFPGHFRNAQNRYFRRLPDQSVLHPHESKVQQGLKNRLDELTRALHVPQTEVVELPLLKLLGHGNGAITEGDSALGGLLLAGMAFRHGKRIRVDWVHRLVVELHRFFHRTNIFGKAFLRYFLQGRTTGQQERLLMAMDRDLESQADLIIYEIAQTEDFPGMAFLYGVAAALKIVQEEVESRKSVSSGNSRLKLTTETPDRNLQ